MISADTLQTLTTYRNNKTNDTVCKNDKKKNSTKSANSFETVNNEAKRSGAIRQIIKFRMASKNENVGRSRGEVSAYMETRLNDRTK